MTADGTTKPVDPMEALAKSLALAEAMKPLEKPTADIYSQVPDKIAARAAIEKAYTDATAAGGALKIKFDEARKAFDRTASDMDRDGWLDSWIAGPLGPKGVVRQLLAERKRLDEKLAPAAGELEKARDEAQAKTQRWAAWFADWSTPVEKMTALIGQYADKIEKLNGDINNDNARDSALLSFWFEVAPKHLQLAPSLGDPVKAVVAKVAAALDDYPDLKGQLTIGPDRGDDDGSLYLIPAYKLAAKRTAVLAKWSEAATEQAKAEAAFKLAPDDAGTLKQAFEKLKGDAWIAEAKKKLP